MLNETLHPEAEDLTNVLFNLGNVEEEDRCYAALENFSSHRGDDAKADLYSLIAESKINVLDRTNAVQVISRCLWLSDKRFPRG